MPNQTIKKPLVIAKVQLHDQKDVPQIKLDLENGKILFIDTKPLFQKYSHDLLVLKKTIDELRQVVIRRGGSIGRVGESILVLSPSDSIKIR